MALRPIGKSLSGASVRQLLVAWVTALSVALVASEPSGAQDTIRVNANSAPKWGMNVKLTPKVSVGVLDGPDEYAFGKVWNIAVDARNQMYVYDAQFTQLRAYDSAGKFLRNIGKKGKGPGEYEIIVGLATVSDSLIAVLDDGTARVTYFSPDGRVRGEFVNARATWGQDGTFIVDNAGLTYVRVPLLAGAKGERLDETDATRRMRILRFRADGTLKDTLVFPVGIQSQGRGFTMSTPDGGSRNFLVESFNTSLKSGGFVSGNSDALRLLIHTSVGPLRVVERSWKPIALSSEERKNWVAIADALTRLSHGEISYAIPAVKPVFRGIQTDNDSRIWVSMFAPTQKVAVPPKDNPRKIPELVWRQQAIYDAFSDKGEYLGRVTLPPRMQLMAAHGNRVWALAHGDDDEEIIKVFTMTGVTPGRP